jgi:ATP-dependent NAD(P)H-hydrate dehydratase
MASKQHNHLISLVKQMIPPLSPKLHKGQAGSSPLGNVELLPADWIGRIGVLGGSGE